MQEREQRDYRVVLRDCLARRCNANQRYSLRAFARDIGLSPGQVSSVISGRRGISLKSAERILDKLDLRSHEKEIYLLQVQRDSARSPKARLEAELAIKDRMYDLRSKELSADAFDVMADWHHFAILQLLCLKHSERSTDKAVTWISSQLKLTEAEVSSALDRLLRLKLISKVKKAFVVVSETILSTDGVPSEALRKFHRQVLTKAIEAIELQSVKERYLNTVMIPVRLDAIESIQKDILQFQKQMMKKYGRNTTKDGEQVYALAQQFFRLSGEKK